MTPAIKAKELFKKFRSKKLAKLCVDAILEADPIYPLDVANFYNNYNENILLSRAFWNDTKKAIDNMGSKHWMSTTSNDPISVGIAYTMIAKGEFVEYLDESPAPVAQPNGDEVATEADAYNNDPAFIAWNKLSDATKDLSSFIDFSDGFNSRQPEVDALREENDRLKADLFSANEAATDTIDAIKKELNHVIEVNKILADSLKREREGNAATFERTSKLEDALGNLVHLHTCEQEGLSAGQPTPGQWLSAVDKASNALGAEWYEKNATREYE